MSDFITNFISVYDPAIPNRHEGIFPALKRSNMSDKYASNTNPAKFKSPKEIPKIATIVKSNYNIPLQNLTPVKEPKYHKRKRVSQQVIMKKAEAVMNPLPPNLDTLKSRLKSNIKISRLLNHTPELVYKKYD